MSPADDLSSLAAALRRAEVPLGEQLQPLFDRLNRDAELVRAFLPEPDRLARLRREAAALELRWPDPDERPALFGVPIGIKDIFHVDGLVTQAGSRLPPEAMAGSEATVVTLLRRAGALVAGKTVTTEFAYFAPGPTRNPRAPEHTPGGSSSGSAAAVGGGVVPLAIGTQTIGSIVRPAAFCGVVGFKPSFDRLPVGGAIPLAPSLDHVGFFTPTAADARLVASVLLPQWRPPPAPPRRRLALPTGPYLERADPLALDHLDRVCERLRQRGWEIEPVDVLQSFSEVELRHRRIVAAEAWRVHREWYEEHRELYREPTRELLERGREVPVAELRSDRSQRAPLRAALDDALSAARADAWIAPAARGPAPLGLDSTGDPIMNLPWTQAGLPAIALPAGTDQQGLPLAVQLVGRWYADEDLLAVAAGVAGDLESFSFGAVGIRELSAETARGASR